MNNRRIASDEEMTPVSIVTLSLTLRGQTKPAIIRRRRRDMISGARSDVHLNGHAKPMSRWLACTASSRIAFNCCFAVLLRLVMTSIPTVDLGSKYRGMLITYPYSRLRISPQGLTLLLVSSHAAPPPFGIVFRHLHAMLTVSCSLLHSVNLILFTVILVHLICGFIKHLPRTHTDCICKY